MQLEILVEKFNEIFKTNASNLYLSPGRVNLIGEHTDYNGGHVFPAAITLGTYGAIKLRGDRKIQCYSMNFEDLGVISFDLDDLNYQTDDSWANYVKGVVKYSAELGQVDRGFDLLVYGNIPNGAGLSSSASLELLVSYALNDLFNLGQSRLDMTLLGQRVENEFIRVNSGIMDQFAVAHGEADQAIFLDVNSMSYEMVPAEFGDYCILIMNTNKRRELADSKYNQRRSECEAALAQLQTAVDINSLGDLDIETFEANKSVIDNPVLLKRAKHAVYENQRTILAKEKLTANDLVAFGQLLNESHISLRDDYDVTGLELDTLVEEAWQAEGVLGARMTGAGMGGCAIALVDKNRVDEVSQQIQSKYEQVVGYPAGFFVAEIGDGVHKLSSDKGGR